MTTSQLRIGIVAPQTRPGLSGGLDHFFIRLVENLRQYAPENRYTILTTTASDAFLTEHFAPLGVGIHALDAHAKWLRMFGPHSRLRRLIHRKTATPARRIDQQHFDVVVFPLTVMGLYGLRTPTVLHVADIQHEYYPDFFSPKELHQRRIDFRASIETAGHIIALSDYTRRTLIEKMGCSPDQVTTGLIGMDARPSPAPEDVETTRARYQLPDDFIFYPAQPWIHKNHARLLAALRKIRDTHHRRLPIVFTGRLENEPPYTLTRLAVAAGVEDQVYDLGYVANDEMAALYCAARFMVFPSLFEGFGMPVLEAMAYGCPVACSDATCLPEVAGDAALLFDPNDTDAIASAVLRLWDDTALRESLRATGRQQVKGFSWETYIRTVVQVYRANA